MKYLKLKKTSPEEERRRKKMKEGTRVASNERRLIILAKIKVELKYNQTFALLHRIAINCNLLNYCNKLQYFNRILAH